MAAAEIDVKYVAHLARIALTPDEEKKLAAQLGGILGYIEKLKELDVPVELYKWLEFCELSYDAVLLYINC